HFVFEQLQHHALTTQARAWQILSEFGAKGNTLFIANALAVSQANTTLTQKLAELPEVAYISADPWIYFNSDILQPNSSPTDRNGIEWGVARVHAPEVWNLGYSGQGITIGGADTGYEWTHPAIKPSYRGWNAVDSSANHAYHWHDAIHEFSPLNYDTSGNPGVNPCGFDAPEPCADHFHGTHTMGTMTGDDGLGNQIGVAPGAKWVGCRNMERGWGRPSTYLECFQWFLAPTDLGGQNADPNLAPHIINNSWYCDYVEGCTDLTVHELLHEAVINLKLSGVLVVVSNGNFGPNCATTYGPPAYFEESFSVGALRSDDGIADFSSRGPVIIDGSDRQKPNISAPGVQVRSADLNGGYRDANGTSMAGPHVAGVAALILSARPDLAGEVEILETIMELTAYPLSDTIDCGQIDGSAVPNNTFGYGGVDALAAVNRALAMVGFNAADQPTPIVAIAPNPVGSEAVFAIENLSGKSDLDIWNASGQLIFHKSWTGIGRESVRAPFQNQKPGVYFWKLTSETGSLSGKIVH
ncbi:MAG: S8 family peptidase, partial [Saprospiraceae bacterium]|nr:S8 family peptidase [Saprospiraceae bacterium]